MSDDNLPQPVTDALRSVRDAVDRLGDQLRESLRIEAEAIATEARTLAEAEAARALDEAVRRARTEADEVHSADLALVRAEGAVQLSERSQQHQRELHEQADAAAAATAAQLSKAAQKHERQLREQGAAATAEAAAMLSEAARAYERQVREHDEAAIAASASGAAAGEVDRVLAGFRRLDGCESLGQVFDALTAIAADRLRAVVVVQAGTALHVWRAEGFSPAELDNLRGLTLDVNQPGVVSRAITSGELARTSTQDRELPTGFLWLPEDRSAVALPIRVGGRPVAGLYADDTREGERTRDGWVAVVEVFVKYAGRCLEALTAARGASQAPPPPPPPPARAVTAVVEPEVRLKPDATIDVPQEDTLHLASSGDEEAARRYARLLVSEIKLYNEAAVRVGRQKKDLLVRLHSEIERSRRLYEERVPAHIFKRDSYFEHELVRTLADGDVSLLGAKPGPERQRVR